MAPSSLERHLSSFFSGHGIQKVSTPSFSVTSKSYVLEISPGIRSRFWTYCSHGASILNSKSNIELFLISLSPDPRAAELVSLVMQYHSHHPIDLNHTFGIGEAWKPRSLCSSFFVSAPECYAPELAYCKAPHGTTRILWLVPITEAEREFAVNRGLPALVEAMEMAELKYWDPFRSCVVTGGSPLDA